MLVQKDVKCIFLYIGFQCRVLNISLEELARFIAFDCSGGFKTLSIIVHSLSLMWKRILTVERRYFKPCGRFSFKKSKSAPEVCSTGLEPQQTIGNHD